MAQEMAAGVRSAAADAAHGDAAGTADVTNANAVRKNAAGAAHAGIGMTAAAPAAACGMNAGQETGEVALLFSRMTVADAAELAALEALCFSLPWSEEAFVKALGQQAFAAFGLRAAGRLVAYMAVYHSGDELEILNIAVRPELRRQGLGARVMGQALQEARKMGMKRGLLEVRVSNAPAIALYESFGFTEAGRRKKYYADTGEDALVYQCDLNALKEPS